MGSFRDKIKERRAHKNVETQRKKFFSKKADSKNFAKKIGTLRNRNNGQACG